MSSTTNNQVRSLGERAADHVSTNTALQDADQTEEGRVGADDVSDREDRLLAEQAAVQKYDEPETVNGALRGWGDSHEYLYLGSFTPQGDHLVERDIPFPVERIEMPFMVHSSRNSSGGGVHEAYIWLRGAWVNVLVSAILNGMEISGRQVLTNHLERWLRGDNRDLEKGSSATTRKQDPLV